MRPKHYKPLNKVVTLLNTGEEMSPLSTVERTRRWKKRHPDKVQRYRKHLAQTGYYKTYRKTHRKECLASARLTHQRIRFRALSIVAQRWGDDEPRCRFDTLPIDHPLGSHQCFGQLQIDHMNGGGSRELAQYRSSTRLLNRIWDGDRDLSDLRILCQLHQLWNTNWERAELRAT